MTTLRYCVNGKLVSGIAPTNRGFAYGDGVFRTMRLQQGVLQDWPLHYQTLVADCSKLHIVCPSAELLMQELKFFVQATAEDNHTSGVIKLMITRGDGARGYAPAPISEPSRIFIQSPMPVYADTVFEHGVALYTCRTRLGHQPLLAGIKHLNRLENVLARAENKDPQFFDGLLMDYQDQVIEAVSGNVFIKQGDRVRTPALDQCGVSGVMRQKMLDWHRTQGVTVEACRLHLADVYSADAVIITNSIYGVLQVNRLDTQTLGHHPWAMALRSQLAHVTY